MIEKSKEFHKKKVRLYFNIILGILLINFFLLSNYGLINAHERSHQAVNKIYGCDSIMEVGWFSGNTKATNCSLNNADVIALKISQSNVESTYVEMFYYRFIIWGLFIMFLISLKNKFYKRFNLN